MPKKPPPSTDWEPLDILSKGRALYASLPREKIANAVSRLLPNWGALDESARGAAMTVVFDALLFLQKARIDHQGLPRVATVKSHLKRTQAAMAELRAALEALDLRTATILKTAAGEGTRSYNSTPLNESPLSGGAYDRGHHRLELLKKAVADAQGWTASALNNTPQQDKRRSDEPGLQEFAKALAYVWESYGGVRFSASRKRGGAPDFISGILRAGNIRCTRDQAFTAALAAVRTLKREHPDRIIVAPEDRSLSLAELARRGSPPQKRKQSATP